MKKVNIVAPCFSCEHCTWWEENGEQFHDCMAYEWRFPTEESKAHLCFLATHENTPTEYPWCATTCKSYEARKDEGGLRAVAEGSGASAYLADLGEIDA